MWPLTRTHRDRGADLLDQAIGAWNEQAASCHEGLSQERLSDEARAVVLSSALDPQRQPATLAALFLPGRALVAAAGLPLLLAGALLLLLEQPGPARGLPASLQAIKRGDRVVFTIANGGRSHQVFRSTVASRFEPASAVKVTGSFADEMEADDPLVFYRIE